MQQMQQDFETMLLTIYNSLHLIPKFVKFAKWERRFRSAGR